MRPLLPWSLIPLSLALTAAGPMDCGGDPPPSPLPEGFIAGANLPWLHYGGDVGENAWGHFGVSRDPQAVEALLGELRAAGITAVRWFILTDGRAAPEFDAQGDVTGLDAVTLADLGAALDAADAVGMSVVPVLLDFYWCAAAQEVSGVTLGGHGDLIADPARRRRLIDAGIVPLLQAFGDHPAVLMWEVINEPEWAMDGRGLAWLGDTVPGDAMEAFVDEVADEVHLWTVHPVTVGAADVDGLSAHWLAGELDVLQYHDYSGRPFRAQADDISDGRPILLGEFPSDTPVTPTLDGALSGGFSGAWPWSVLAEDDASGDFLPELSAWVAAHPDEVWPGR